MYQGSILSVAWQTLILVAMGDRVGYNMETMKAFLNFGGKEEVFMRSISEWKRIYNTEDFKANYTYTGQDLGCTCTEGKTSFVLWSPLAEEVCLYLYKDGESGEAYGSFPMEKGEKGTWRWETEENLNGVYYDFRLSMDGEQVCLGDPYARACGVNGKRSMAVLPGSTDPKGWKEDKAPAKAEENIIYEIHVKEFSWDRSGGFPEKDRGKYTAFTKEHTTLNNDGIHPTGMDYMKQLGVTYVQLMPVYDYGSVDEKDDHGFNWGYDPVNYNVPEGSYSTDPCHGEVRIREFKEMIQALHKNGFRVIMDVVYNHMYSLDTNLNKAVPWYYYRSFENGEISNGSACGNDIASERPMCGDYILRSVLYWAEEYHIDGFRFDLMGLLDTDLMNRIRKELDVRYGKGEKLVYGEPWAADKTAMEGSSIQALKSNIGLLDENVGMFCDDTRDAIKGHVFEAKVPGFVNGKGGLEEKILDSVKAWCIPGSQIKSPAQIISYISAHDNLTLWDKLLATMKGASREKLLRVNKLAAAVYMTCQGNLFLLSGEEFARTKDGEENSFNLPIELNRLDWQRAYENEELVSFYQGLIRLRKQMPGLCDKTAQAFERIRDLWVQSQTAGFTVDNLVPGKHAAWTQLYIAYNASDKVIERPLPEGDWEILVKDGRICDKAFCKDVVTVEPVSAVILGKRP